MDILKEINKTTRLDCREYHIYSIRCCVDELSLEELEKFKGNDLTVYVAVKNGELVTTPTTDIVDFAKMVEDYSEDLYKF